MADYPLSIGRGNEFGKKFRFRNEYNEVIRELMNVRFTIGIGDTVFVRKELTRDMSYIYSLILNESETRMIMKNFRYEIEVNRVTVLSGPVETTYGDNLDDN